MVHQRPLLHLLSSLLQLPWVVSFDLLVVPKRGRCRLSKFRACEDLAFLFHTNRFKIILNFQLH